MHPTATTHALNSFSLILPVTNLPIYEKISTNIHNLLTQHHKLIDKIKYIHSVFLTTLLLNSSNKLDGEFGTNFKFKAIILQTN